MHFVWFSKWDGFFSPRVSESRPSRVATRVGFRDEWWEIHLTWKTIQNAFSRILYTLRHFNQTKYYVQSCRSWKPCEMDLSHNCSLHGGRSEVCEKGTSLEATNRSLTFPVNTNRMMWYSETCTYYLQRTRPDYCGPRSVSSWNVQPKTSLSWCHDCT